MGGLTMVHGNVLVWVNKCELIKSLLHPQRYFILVTRDIM